MVVRCHRVILTAGSFTTAGLQKKKAGRSRHHAHSRRGFLEISTLHISVLAGPRVSCWGRLRRRAAQVQSPPRRRPAARCAREGPPGSAGAGGGSHRRSPVQSKFLPAKTAGPETPPPPKPQAGNTTAFRHSSFQQSTLEAGKAPRRAPNEKGASRSLSVAPLALSKTRCQSRRRSRPGRCGAA